MNEHLVRELWSAAEHLKALGGHGQDPDDIEARVHEFDKAALRAYISACSEEYDCSSWGAGFPEALWTQLTGGRKIVCDERIRVARRLCRRAGGWWHWPRGADGPVFVAMSDWLKMVEVKA